MVLLLDSSQIQQIEINSLLDKIVKAWAMKILTELGERIDEHSEIFNKELENIKKDLIRNKEFNKWNWKKKKKT